MIRSYAVRWKDAEHESFVNARSAGQAKMEYLRELDGCFPDVRFTDLRVRVADARAQSSRDFIRCVEYRGIGEVRCGDRVQVGEAFGYVVGHNGSANLEVLFDEGSPKYAGLRLPVHPDSCVFRRGREVNHGGTEGTEKRG